MNRIWVIHQKANKEGRGSNQWVADNYSLATTKKESIYLFMGNNGFGWMYEDQRTKAFKEMQKTKEVKVVEYKATLVKKKRDDK